MLPAEKNCGAKLGGRKEKQKPSKQDGDGAGKEEQGTCGFQRQPKVGRNLGRSDGGWLLI